jgi:hypothetical protein
MLEIVVIDLDDEFTPIPKTHKKVVTNVNCKFQEIWVIKVPWAKPIFNEVGVLFIIICHVCTRIEKKKKIWLQSGIILINMYVKERVHMVSGSWIQNVCM